MCGIAGAIGQNLLFVNTETVKSMTDKIAHRGPDGEGMWTNTEGSVVLAHRRLSILDLSSAGAQPMHYADKYSMVFNGEIYNYIELRNYLSTQGYKFKSESDSEVLLALYDNLGEKCLDELDGMFAFAIWDENKGQLFCARDRFGEKPFYFSQQDGALVFCSEIKGLWASGIERKVNDIMVFNYVFFGNVYNPENLDETFYSNIKSLPPATYMILNKYGQILSYQKYWDIDFKYQNNDVSFDQACITFQELFDLSVKRKLRSDVALGSSLSGGLDSSSIVCTIDKLKDDNVPQKTFSARFPGFKKDESKYIDDVLKKVDATGYSCFPDMDLLTEVIDKVIYIQDEPFRSLSIVVQYEVMAIAKKENTIVLLDGQGADEYLGGYHGFIDCYFNELYSENKREFQNQFDVFRKLHADNKINAVNRRLFGMYAKRSLTNTQINRLYFIKALFANFDNLSSVKDLFLTHRNDVFQSMHHSSSLNEMLFHYTMKGSLQELLRYADRNSMAHSREVRLPFLYHKLVEFVFTLPSSFKINNGYTKYILRKSMEGRMPESIVWRKDKIGYEPPNKNQLGDKNLNQALIHAFRLR